MPTDRAITITTPLAPDALLFDSLRGEEALGRPFEYRVNLLSPDPGIDMSKILGQPMTVHIKQQDESPRHFNGLVSRFAMVGAFGKHVRYEATLRPWVWFLKQRTNCRIFQAKTVPDIVKAIFREHGQTDFEEHLTGTYATWEYCVQYRESDLHFVSRLMELEGIYFFFKHTDGKHTMVIADGVGAHEPIKGYETITYHPSEERFADDHLDRWGVSREVRPGAFASTDYDFKRPKANLTSVRQAPAGHALDSFERFDYPGEYEKSDEGDAYAQIRMEALQSEHETVEGGGTARGLITGGLFKLAEFPAADQNKQYVITGASYRLQAESYSSGGGSAGGREFNCQFRAIDAQRPIRAAQLTGKPVVEGPQTAIVVGKEGEEIWTDEFGRVKVQFHWDREGKLDENSSCWIRTSQTWADKRWGAQFLPRMGQEVIVEFLEGDPDRPIITGCVYNGDNMPPYELPTKATQSGIKSRSSKDATPNNFNELRFEDKKAAEEVYLQAEKDFNILVKNDESRNVGHDRKKEVGNDETVLVHGNRTETVDKDETITIHGNRTETVDKDETIVIHGKRTETVDKDENITIQGSRTEVVQKDETITVSGARAESVSKDEQVSIKGGRTHSVDKDSVLTVGKSLKVKAGDEITFVTGAASITLKSSGDIVIKGTGITVQGATNVNVSSSGQVGLKAPMITQN